MWGGRGGVGGTVCHQAMQLKMVHKFKNGPKWMKIGTKPVICVANLHSQTSSSNSLKYIGTFVFIHLGKGPQKNDNHTLISKLHCFFKHYIHLQLYSICSCT